MRCLPGLFSALFRNFIRDPMNLFWFIAFPLLFILLFGSLFSGEESLHYTVSVVDEDGVVVGPFVREALRGVPNLGVEDGDAVEPEVERLRAGEIRAVVHVPSGASLALVEGRETRVEVYSDPTHQVSSQVILTMVERVLRHVEEEIRGERALLVMEARSIHAVRLRNIDYILPGILGMALMQLGIFGSMDLLWLREKQILKRLAVTPVTRTSMIGAEVLVRLLIAVVQTGVIITTGRLVFDVRLAGSLLVLSGVVLLGAVTFISMGYMLASLARTVEGGTAMAQMVQFPMMFLSGIFFPIEVMPDFLRPVVTLFPLTYLGDALRQVMVEASPLYLFPVNVAVLLGWAVVSLFVALRFFRWE